MSFPQFDKFCRRSSEVERMFFMFPWNLFPFNNDTKKLFQQMKPEDIQKYVQEMTEKMFLPQMQKSFDPQQFFKGWNPLNRDETPSDTDSSALQTSVFETHDFVFVQIIMNDQNWLKDIKIFHTSNQLIIKHIPSFNDEHKITLPTLVKKKGSTAQVMDNILEVKLPKNPDMQFSEIDVTERI
jgi:HSP20 family molecular chaperone IbpA